MTPEILEKELTAGSLNNIYLLYGEEEFLLNTCVKKIKKLFGEMILGINYIQIDETNIDSLISEIQTPAFGFPKKLIIVKDEELFKKTKSVKGKETNKEDNSIQSKIAEFIK